MKQLNDRFAVFMIVYMIIELLDSYFTQTVAFFSSLMSCWAFYPFANTDNEDDTRYLSDPNLSVSDIIRMNKTYVLMRKKNDEVAELYLFFLIPV